MKVVSTVLEKVLGRLPIGWLQLIHNKPRLAAAVAGVTFANVLVFMQLGFLGGLVGSIKLPYDQMNADLMVSANDMNSLADGSPIPRQRMFQTLGVNGVASATPVYYAKVDWKLPDGSIRTLDVFGIDPAASTFNNLEIQAHLSSLAASDIALLDRKTRNVPNTDFAAIDRGIPLVFELKGRTLSVVGTFTIGGGFSADGYMLVSDQTFLKLFPHRIAGAPNHIFVKLQPASDRQTVLARLRAVLPGYDSTVRTVAEAVARDQSFQTTQKPVGLIFGFGIVIGVIVGIIIIYQVLATDVADHIKEYATFKAIGYRHRFFLGLIFEEAAILATLGFVPALAISLGMYAIVANATGLPISMTPTRPVIVLVGTFATCLLAGALATRRLVRANPAELF